MNAFQISGTLCFIYVHIIYIKASAVISHFPPKLIFASITRVILQSHVLLNTECAVFKMRPFLPIRQKSFIRGCVQAYIISLVCLCTAYV